MELSNDDLSKLAASPVVLIRFPNGKGGTDDLFPQAVQKRQQALSRKTPSASKATHKFSIFVLWLIDNNERFLNAPGNAFLKPFRFLGIG